MFWLVLLHFLVSKLESQGKLLNLERLNPSRSLALIIPEAAWREVCVCVCVCTPPTPVPPMI